MKFYDLYINELVTKEEIHNFIDEWHTTEFGMQCKLYDFLGLTKEQYYEWVDTDKLKII